MKRDLDLIRDILLDVENRDHPQPIFLQGIAYEGKAGNWMPDRPLERCRVYRRAMGTLIAYEAQKSGKRPNPTLEHHSAHPEVGGPTNHSCRESGLAFSGFLQTFSARCGRCS